jgi:hypothetical protein
MFNKKENKKQTINWFANPFLATMATYTNYLAQKAQMQVNQSKLESSYKAVQMKRHDKIVKAELKQINVMVSKAKKDAKKAIKLAKETQKMNNSLEKHYHKIKQCNK